MSINLNVNGKQTLLLWIFLSLALQYQLAEVVVPAVFYKKVFLKNSQNSHENKCVSLFFNKVAGLRPATLLKKRSRHECFPVNFANFLKTLFLKEPLRWLLLNLLKKHWPGSWIHHELLEGVTYRCPEKKLLWKMSHSSQENSHEGVLVSKNLVGFSE